MYIFSDNNLRMFASCQLSRSGAMKTEISPPKYKTYCGAHVCTETGGNGGVLPNKCEQDEKRKEFKNIFFRETAWEKAREMATLFIQINTCSQKSRWQRCAL